MDAGALVNEQYKIIEHIGRGGMADVWSARDTRLRRMVAIKTIVAGLSNDIDPVDLFKREAHTIAQMEHPHILPIYDFGEHDNNLYIVMRYVTGGSLEDLLRDGPMPPQDVLRMGDAIAQALDYAHENNVIHLDLKPPNILLDSSGAPYLADFGLATVLDPEGRARNPGSGTLLYMAPEQMMSDTIDHRADIYAFSIMLYHMLTGILPFDGNVPLSMSQLQRDLGLPDLDDHVDYLPHDLSELLRLGTNQDPKFRPTTHMEIMDQFRNIIQPAGIGIGSGSGSFDDDYRVVSNPYDMLTEVYEGNIQDADLLEAIDIYSRARYDWQGGQGRFLLGVTNFILMSDYYQQANSLGLSIDTAGYQVLLRGAIEYDHEIEYWWYKLADDDRRWVCLHALRSGNTPARIRALYRLETLPDEQGTAVIPRLVAQALEIETDETAKLAALRVLGTRIRLMRNHPEMRIQTQYRGRLITSMTRLGIDVLPKDEWRESAYSGDVDILIAEEAFDASDVVAEAAARTVGKIRSLKAVAHLSREQQNKRSGALDALAFVRDEAPSLPDIVRPDARFYAWITNSVRRLTDNPVTLIANIALVFIMGWIAMGVFVWGSWTVTVGSLNAQRWTNAVGFGVIFGLVTALTYTVTVVPIQRLRGFWSWWLRLIIPAVLGFGLSTLIWTSYRFFFLQEALFELPWDIMRFAGASLTVGLMASSLLRLDEWQGVLLTIFSSFTAIFLTHQTFYTEQDANIAPVVLVALLIGVIYGWRAKQLVDRQGTKSRPDVPLFTAIGGIVIGIVWALANWSYLMGVVLQQAQLQTFTWDGVLLLAGINLLFGFISAYYLRRIGRISLITTAIIAFVVGMVITAPQIYDYRFGVPLVQPAFDVLYSEGTPLSPPRLQPLIFYSFGENNLWTLALPLVVVIALAFHTPSMLNDWWRWIGASRTPKERGAWLTGILGYVMILTAIISLLTLYSPRINRLWELSWSFWAFVTFIFAMATMRWTKWGANGLIASGLVLLLGGIAFDGVTMYQSAINGMYPRLLSPLPQFSQALQVFGISVDILEYQLWGVWATMLAVFVWAAQRRYLWGGIGLVTLTGAWILLVFSSTLQGSVAVFVATNVALVFYALQSKYHLMETGRLNITWLGRTPDVADDGVPQTIVHATDGKFRSAPATQILPNLSAQNASYSDDLQTQTPSADDLRNLETVDFSGVPDIISDNDIPITINPEDLYTAVPSKSNEFVAFDTDDSAFDPMMTNPDDIRQQVSAEGGLTDIKIDLDTSAINQAKQEKLPDTEPDVKRSGGLADIKINLDTSALNQEKSTSTTEETLSEPATRPSPIFKFDASNVLDTNTTQFERNDTDNEDDEE